MLKKISQLSELQKIGWWAQPYITPKYKIVLCTRIYIAGDRQQYQRTKLSGYTCLEEIASPLTQFSCLCLNDNIDQLCV